MNREDINKKFIDAILAILAVRHSVGDDFFKSKIRREVDDLFSDYLKLIAEGTKGRQLQDFLVQKLTARINTCLETFETLRHLKVLSENSPLLLFGFKKLLGLKLSTIKMGKGPVASTINSKTALPPTQISAEIKEVLSQSKDKVKEKGADDVIDVNSNKMKILNYIKNYPDKRTKDIVYEFNAFSDRTVKRTLAGLLKEGLIKKRVQGDAAYYSVNE